MSRKRVIGSVWVEFSEQIGDRLVRKTVKVDNRALILDSITTQDGNNPNIPIHWLEVKVPDFKVEL